jgi:hypothetical protein
VVDGLGRPLRGAHVALGVDTTVTPDDGTFAFLLDDPNSMSARFGMPRDALSAVVKGSAAGALRASDGERQARLARAS